MSTPLAATGAVWDDTSSSTRVRSEATRVGPPRLVVKPTLLIVGLAYLVLTALFVGLGLLVAHVLAHGAIGHWDVSVDRWFASHRGRVWNDLSAAGSQIANTPAVIVVASVAALLLAWKRAWPAVALLVIGLVLEVSVFVSTTFVVDRDRPPVPKLDQAPPTSSFPSGHVAAAVVLCTLLAIIITGLVRKPPVSVALWVVAIVVPLGVGLSRLSRGMHHPTDVIAGVGLGVSCVLIALLAVAVAFPRQEAQRYEPERER